MTATKAKTRSTKPQKPPPNTYKKLTPDPDHKTQSIGAQIAAAKAATPSAIEQALRGIPAQECPSRFTKVEPKKETWREAFAANGQMLKDWYRWTGRKLLRLVEVIGFGVTCGILCAEFPALLKIVYEAVPAIWTATGVLMQRIG